MDKKSKPKKPFYKRWWFFAIIIIVIIGAINGGDDEGATDNEEQNENQNEEVENQDINENNSTNQEDINENDDSDIYESIREFEADMDLDVSEDAITMTITSNVPDGGLFEISIMDSQFNIESDIVPIEGGKIVYDFPTDKFEIGYLSAIAQFRFNLEDHPQPDEILEIYGENGELMTGDNVVENNLNGYNGNVEGVTFAYPDESTVEAAMNTIFEEAINEMIEVSEGVILDIRPSYGNDWSLTDVIVSDAWYFSQEYEKERFAEQIGETVETLVINAGKADGVVSVYFKDEYGAELATPKMFGGYKIKR